MPGTWHASSTLTEDEQDVDTLDAEDVVLSALGEPPHGCELPNSQCRNVARGR